MCIASCSRALSADESVALYSVHRGHVIVFLSVVVVSVGVVFLCLVVLSGMCCRGTVRCGCEFWVCGEFGLGLGVVVLLGVRAGVGGVVGSDGLSLSSLS